MDNEVLDTNYQLLRDCAELDELIGWFCGALSRGALSVYGRDDGHRSKTARKCMAPDHVRTNSSAAAGNEGTG